MLIRLQHIMLVYYLFWMIMGSIIHFYITFGTNLLTGGPTHIAVSFAYFSISKKRNIKRSPNGMKPSRELFLEQTWSRGLGVDVKKETRRPRGREARLPLGRTPTLVGPSQLHRRASSSYIYTHIPRKHPRAPRNPISTAATFCTREIPSWGLFRRSAGGALITEGFYINTIAFPMMCE